MEDRLQFGLQPQKPDRCGGQEQVEDRWPGNDNLAHEQEWKVQEEKDLARDRQVICGPGHQRAVGNGGDRALPLPTAKAMTARLGIR
jgi:hypothetical protein